MRGRAAKSLPHVVDTVLLLSALTLAWMLRLTPGERALAAGQDRRTGRLRRPRRRRPAARRVAGGSGHGLGGGPGHGRLDRLRGPHQEPEGLPRAADRPLAA